MSRLRAALDAAGAWLLAAWPLAMRSTLERSERALMSVVGELERVGAHHEQALADQDAIAVDRDDLAAQLLAARAEIARLRRGEPADVAELRRELHRLRRANNLLDNRLAVAEGRPVVEVDA